MRKLTKEEFKALILEQSEEEELYGLTNEEVDIYYFYFIMGRQSVRW